LRKYGILFEFYQPITNELYEFYKLSIMFTGKCRHNAELNHLASSNRQKATTTAFDRSAHTESDVSAEVPESPTGSISSKFMKRLRLLKYTL
jgi:hypothetical protein